MKYLPIAYGIQNFKAFGAQPNSVPLRPITLVFGPNSAGKSSLLHSLLWLNEAIRTNTYDFRYPHIADKAVDLGFFSQFIHGHDVNKRITVETTFQESHFSDEVREFFSLEHGIKVSFTVGKMTLGTHTTKNNPWAIQPWILDIRLEDQHGNIILSLIRNKLAGYKIATLDTLNSIFSKHCEDFRSYEIADKYLDDVTVWYDPDQVYDEEERKDYALFPESIGLMVTFADKSSEDPVDKFWANLGSCLARLFSDINHCLIKSIGDMRYVPPLRSLPARYIDFANSDHCWYKIFAEPECLNKINKWLGNKCGSYKANAKSGYELTLSTFYSQSYLQRNLPNLAQQEVLQMYFDQKNGLNTVFEEEWKELTRRLHAPFLEDAETYLYIHPRIRTEIINTEISNLDYYKENYNDFPKEDHDWDTPENFIDRNLNWQAYINEESLTDPESLASELFHLWLNDHHEVHNLLRRHSTTHESISKFLNKKVFGSGKLEDFIDREEVRLEIQLRDLRNQVNVSLQDIGIGISQVLPVLMEAYGSKQKFIAIEQPEIHIHPKLQSDLADLFIESSLGQNQNAFLLETHSEHLILRLLRRIRETSRNQMQDWPEDLKAACPNGIRPDDVSVLYVEPAEEGSRIRQLRINDQGRFIDEWPNGFFEDRLEELI
jgi:predicted ATPase